MKTHFVQLLHQCVRSLASNEHMATRFAVGAGERANIVCDDTSPKPPRLVDGFYALSAMRFLCYALSRLSRLTRETGALRSDHRKIRGVRMKFYYELIIRRTNKKNEERDLEAGQG